MMKVRPTRPICIMAVLSVLVVLYMASIMMNIYRSSRFDDAIRNNDVPLIHHYINDGFSIDHREARTGFTALVRACLNGDSKAVSSIIDMGADTSLPSGHRRNPLGLSKEAKYYDCMPPIIAALISQDVSSAELLVRHGAAPNVFDNVGTPAILYSVHHMQTMELLLENGADPDLRDTSRMTALMEAALEGNAEIVRLLLRYGADPTMRNWSGESAEDLAVARGHVDIAALLRDAEKMGGDRVPRTD